MNAHSKSRPSLLSATVRRPAIPLHLLVLPALLLCLLIYCAWAWWVSPEHRVQQFVQATNRQDFATDISLADASEVRHLGLSVVTFRALMSDIAANNVPLRLRGLRWLPLPPTQTRINRIAAVTLYRSDGIPVTGASGYPVVFAVPAYRARSGWKISLSSLLYSMMLSRHGWDGRYERWSGLCHRYRLRSELFEPERGVWAEIPPVDNRSESAR